MSDKTPHSAAPLALEVVAMSKRFGTFVALDEVSLGVREGSFHALLGENGAGKSTLVKCIMGYYRPDDGALVVWGRERTFSNPREAHALGLGMVYQHFTLVPNMTVAENLLLARPTLPAVIPWMQERERLSAFMDTMPFRVDLDARITTLSAGEKQKVELLKQLYLDRRLIILDEPTSVLTPGEADDVLGLLHTMTRQGRLTVVMITHKLREVEAYTDAVTVLRRGKAVGTGLVGTLSTTAMTEMMIGSRDIPAALPRVQEEAGPPRLVLHGVRALNDRGAPALRGVALTLHAGEIVGVAGVSGNGQRELVEILAGQRVPVAGEITVEGQPYQATRRQMTRHGVCCLPEEPLHNACVPRMSVTDNLLLRCFDRPPLARAGWWLQFAAMARVARDLMARYRIAAPSPRTPIAHLSGGNVQRTVLARALSDTVAVLIVANPCFGLDIAAAADIRAQIMAARNRGAAVLLVSEDLDEILALADRILVMSHGQIVYETPIQTATVATIGHHMAAH
ncbi:MAG: ABC transporter ATP-binding protein [Candidatus Tectomicrobia bacterium]|uniref:ABC transporter ATP-binding protein n=1 Tax=Tectimicrobiota bacterium TaxID=2528274 RepID=A0A937W1X4_UNCTE|nr:ABC transporter ATP-binding protein [Candidatus Tectomicrobia bacterium]